MTRSFDVLVDGQVLIVTIDRQERRNALDSRTNHELGAVFDRFCGDPGRCRVAILTGAGDRAFCAGADLRESERTGEPPVPASGFGGLTNRFGRTKPVIAAVNGAAMGGGFELALACDLVVAAEHATFGLPEPRVGLAAMSGGVQRLLREVGPKRAHAILLTGRHVPAEEGQRLGFVNEVTPPGELMAAARRWADQIVACSPASLRATAAIVDAFDGRSIEAALADMPSLAPVQELIGGPDAGEGVAAFTQRRAPRWAAS